MSIKIIASLFQFLSPHLVSFSAMSFPMLFVWVTDDFSAEFFAFKSAFGAALYGVYFLVWIVIPWLTISKKRVVTIIGLSFVMGLNLFDIICCILSALPILVKTLNLSFSILIIGLSFRAIHKTWDRGRFSCPLSRRSNEA